MARIEGLCSVAYAVSVGPEATTKGERPELAEPTTTVNTTTVTELLLLVEEQKRVQAKGAERRAEAQEVAATKAEAAVLDAMRSEASNAFVKGIASGLTSMATGTLQVIGASMSLEAAKIEPKAANLTASVLAKKGELVSSWAPLAKGVGEALSALPDSAMRRDQVDQKAGHNEAQAAQRRAVRETEFANSSRELSRKTLERLEAILQAHQQSLSALIARA